MADAARDMAAVDELCRLALAANRLGCRVQLVDVEPCLRELLLLAGVDDLLVDARQPSKHLTDPGDLR